MKYFLLVLLLPLLNMECHAYKAYNKNTNLNPFRGFVEQGGYRDFPLSDDRFMVSYEASCGHTAWGKHNSWNQKTRAKGDQVVFNNAFKRCVELTISRGFKYFEIVSEKGEDILTEAGSLNSPSVYRFTVTLEIRCFNEYKEGAYVAQE